jgi:hypothetical protein
MFNLLGADCDRPRVSSSLPDRKMRRFKIRVGEYPDGHRDHAGNSLGFPECRAPAFRTEMEGHDPTAVRLTRAAFVSARNGPNSLSREPCLNSECASCPALAFKTVAHRDANGFALADEPKLPATARGFMICHSSLSFTLKLSGHHSGRFCASRQSWNREPAWA